MSVKYPVVSMSMAVALATACRGGVEPADEIPNGATVGPLEVTLGGDASVTGNVGEVSSNVEEVWVRIEDIQIEHEEKGWVGVLDARTDVDLLSLRGLEPELVASADTYEGGYDALRLIVADSWIVVDGVESDLVLVDNVGIATDGELTFDVTYFVDKNTTTVLWVGWDLDALLSESGSGWNLGTGASIGVDLHD